MNDQTLEDIVAIIKTLRNLMETTRADINILKRNEESYSLVINNMHERMRKIEEKVMKKWLKIQKN